MDRELRVLHILGELRPSGAECMLKVAAREFESHRIRIEILSTGDAHIGSYAQVLRDVGYLVHHVPFSKSILFFVRIHRLLRARQFDVVHIHSERANFWFGLVANLASIPRVISTIHGTFAFQGWLRLRRMVFRRLQEQLGVVRVAISKSVQDVEWKYFRSNVAIIPNWYDSQRFRPPSTQERVAARARFGLEVHTFVVVSVGNCSEVKNHPALIKAIALLPVNLDIIYLHVGAEQMHTPEQQLAKSLGILDRIRFLGPMDDPLPALHAADTYVMPSMHEGFGNAALEALAVGLPTILSNVSGLKDFAAHYANIKYVKPNAESLAQAIVELAGTDDKLRMQMTGDYALRSQEGFGVNVGVARYVELYRAA